MLFARSPWRLRCFGNQIWRGQGVTVEEQRDGAAWPPRLRIGGGRSPGGRGVMEGDNVHTLCLGDDVPGVI